MCEFKVKRNNDVLAEEVLSFSYLPSGEQARFADVLGRAKSEANVLVTAVNMLPGRHEITLLQSPAAGKAVQLAIALSRKGTPEFDAKIVKQLLRELEQIVDKELK